MAHDRSRWEFDYSVMMRTWASVVSLFVISGCDSSESVATSESVPAVDGPVLAIKTPKELEACVSLLESAASSRARDQLKQLLPAPEWVVSILIGHLGSADKGIRFRAAWAMGLVVGSGQLHLAPLVDAVTDENDLVRAEAVRSLGVLLERGLHTHDETVRKALVTALADHDPDVRMVAALWCVSLGPVASDDAARYFALATDPNTDVRIAGLDLLASTAKRYREVGQVLLTALRDSDPEIRHGAALAMGKYYEHGDDIAIAALVNALARESDSDAALGMAVALPRIGFKYAELIAKRLKGATRTGTLGLLTVLAGVAADDRARPHIAPLAKSDDPEIKVLAKEVLSMWGDR